ncbi:MAG: phage baseplate assembly protein V [Pseudomonadota bacterium]
MDYKENTSELNDLDRKSATHIMMGTIVKVDSVTGKATVNINGKEVPDLMVMAQRAGSNGKTCWLPAAGEQVIIISPFGNLMQGIIAGSIYYGEKDNENHTDMPVDIDSMNKNYYNDGTTTSYDSKKHELVFSLKEDAIKIRAYADDDNKESGLEISHGDISFTTVQKENNNAFVELKKGNAYFQLDKDQNISIKTDKNIEISAGNITLTANQVDVKKK